MPSKRKIVFKKLGTGTGKKKFDLWIQFEDDYNPTKISIKSHDLDLADLAKTLCEEEERLENLNLRPGKLQFFKNDGNEPFLTDIQIRHLKTTAMSPLVIRFPLSDNTIRVNLTIPATSKHTRFSLPHSTGFYDDIFARVKQDDPTLQDDGTVLSLIDKTTKLPIDNKFFIYDMLTEILRFPVAQRVISIIVNITVNNADEKYEKLIEDKKNLAFVIGKFNNFKKSDMDIPENDIIWNSSLTTEPIDQNDPQFVQDFVDRLNKKRSINSNESEYLPILMKRMEANAPDSFSIFFEDSQSESPDVCIEELTSYLALFDGFTNISSTVLAKSSSFKVSHFTSFLVDPALLKNSGYDKRTDWVPSLLVRESGSDQIRKYSPKSDFRLSSQYGPFLLGETVSDPTSESDRIRMLLQASTVCRLANTIRNEKDFVLICYYINNKYEAERYIIWQPNGGSRKVQIKLDQLSNLTKASEAFQILFQMFNFNKILPDLESQFDQDKAMVLNNVDILTNKVYGLSLSSKPHDSNQSGSQSGQLLRVSEHTGTLREHGYIMRKILSSRPHVALAISTKMQAPVVIKCINKQSNELLILQKLNSVEPLSDHNHTIPLFATIQLNKNTSAIVMPDFRPLSMLTEHHVRFTKLTEVQCISFAKQLFESIDFIHEQGIAHLDIKPSNIVIDDRSNKLFIIDYGLAEQLKYKGAMLTGCRGTKGYTAPEVDNETYNPFHADMWSIGMVIHKLFKDYASQETQAKIGYLDVIARKLMDSNPTERPSSSEAIEMLDQVVATHFKATEQEEEKYTDIFWEYTELNNSMPK